MRTRNEHLILSASITGSGYHPGAAARPLQVLDVAHFRHLVQTAERGLLDFVFLHDERALPDAAVTGRLDALSVLARLAPETKFVGLAVSLPTTYSEPFNVSRALATLDFVSGGRAAWNATSAASDAEAHNFGKQYAPDADERSSIAEECIEISRSPHRNIDEARAFYADLTKRLTQYGRSQAQLRILPGLAVVVAPAEAQAQAKAAYYRTLLGTPAIGRYLLGEQSGNDFSDVDLDGPFPDVDTTRSEVNGELLERWKTLATNEHLTVQQLIDRVTPRRSLVGSPTQIADHFQAWLETEASDGFILTPTLFPGDLDDFVALVVPELQRRGLFRTEYEGHTLRDHLGLKRPAVPARALAQ